MTPIAKKSSEPRAHRRAVPDRYDNAPKIAMLDEIPEQAGYTDLLSAERPESAARVGDEIARSDRGRAIASVGRARGDDDGFGQVVRVIDETPDRVDQAGYVMSAEPR